MSTTALYFPYIEVPSKPWFTQALLYWDDVGTIMPAEFVEDRYQRFKYAAELIQSGLLRPIHPMDRIHQIPAFQVNFIRLVDACMKSAEFGRWMRMGQRWQTVHIEKLGGLEQQLQERKLIRSGGINQRLGRWVAMPQWLASLFMTYLATSFRQIDNRIVPITDNDECWCHLGGAFPLDVQQPSAPLLYRRREQVLSFLFPVPADGVSPIEIVRFKEKHRDMLHLLRRTVEGCAVRMAQCADYDRDALWAAEQATMTEQILEIRGAMKQWRVVVAKTLAVMPLGYAVGAEIMRDTINATNLLFAAAPVAAALFDAANTQDSLEVRSKPLAYAAAFQRQFPVQ